MADPLGDLGTSPAEMRNEVYEYAALETTISLPPTIHDGYQIPWENYDDSRPLFSGFCAGLVRTSKTIFSEFAELCATATHFTVPIVVQCQYDRSLPPRNYVRGKNMLPKMATTLHIRIHLELGELETETQISEANRILYNFRDALLLDLAEAKNLEKLVVEFSRDNVARYGDRSGYLGIFHPGRLDFLDLLKDIRNLPRLLEYSIIDRSSGNAGCWEKRVSLLHSWPYHLHHHQVINARCSGLGPWLRGKNEVGAGFVPERRFGFEYEGWTKFLWEMGCKLLLDEQEEHVKMMMEKLPGFWCGVCGICHG